MPLGPLAARMEAHERKLPPFALVPWRRNVRPQTVGSATRMDAGHSIRPATWVPAPRAIAPESRLVYHASNGCPGAWSRRGYEPGELEWTSR